MNREKAFGVKRERFAIPQAYSVSHGPLPVSLFAAGALL
jgi:hypothetical protein